MVAVTPPPTVTTTLRTAAVESTLTADLTAQVPAPTAAEVMAVREAVPLMAAAVVDTLPSRPMEAVEAMAAAERADMAATRSTPMRRQCTARTAVAMLPSSTAVVMEEVITEDMDTTPVTAMSMLLTRYLY